MARARAGDPAATAAVVACLRPRLEKMAGYYARLTNNDADDLLQEAWLGLLESLPRLDLQIGCPQQYLIQQARWRLLDASRRATRQPCVSVSDDEDLLDELGADCIELESMLAERTVEEFVRGLNPMQRMVLRCLLRGMTWRETGVALGCSSANVAYHVRKIREHYLNAECGMQDAK